MKSFIQIIFAITLLLVIASCSKIEVETPSVNIEAYKWLGYIDTVANPSQYSGSDFLIQRVPGINRDRESILTNAESFEAGDPLVFIFDHSADLLSIYPGDTLHRYDKSALALVDRSRIEGEIFAEKIDSVNRFKIDYNNAFQLGTELPSSLSFSAGQPELTEDEKFRTGGLLVNSSNLGGSDTLVLTISDADIRLGANQELLMDYRPVTEAGEQDSTVIQVSGSFNNIAVDTLLSLTNTRLGAYGPIYFDLSLLLGKWIADNGYPADGNPELTELTVKMYQLDAATAWNDLFFKLIQVSENEYLPFDTGFPVIISDEGYADFQYTYAQAGTYTVTAIGTNNGYRDYDGDPILTGADQYDINRRMVQIEVTIVDPAE